MKIPLQVELKPSKEGMSRLKKVDIKSSIDADRTTGRRGAGSLFKSHILPK
jgi:hypothetical protein